MEAESLQKDRVHHGHNIRRVRRQKGIKQEVMASLVNLSLQTVSRYESMSLIDDEMLDRFAKALESPVEYLKETEEDVTSIVIENNTFENNDKVTNVGYMEEDNSTTVFNPIDKVVELYERLLKLEKERNDTFEKRLLALEQRFDDEK